MDSNFRYETNLWYLQYLEALIPITLSINFGNTLSDTASIVSGLFSSVKVDFVLFLIDYYGLIL